MIELSSYILGSWQLKAYVESDDADNPHLPLGRQPVGTIMYGPDGRMSAQIMKQQSDSDTGGLADAYFLAYSATFTVDEGHSTVSHAIEVSAIRSWLDTVQSRAVSIIDDDTMVLSTQAPVLTSTGRRMARLTWKRYLLP